MRRCLSLLVLFLLCLPLARATIIGLNQIITPDLQPKGLLAVSLQAQDPKIGNETEFQLELGLTDWLEASVFQGIKPGEGIFSVEGSLLKNGPHLLSAGLINLSTRGYGPQPVLEYGYYLDHDQFSVGAIDANRTAEPVLGYRHVFNDTIALAADFQGGRENFSTIGFVYNFTPSFSVNPAVYFPNSGRRQLRAYIVFTWTNQLWK